jgi:hypothetical protein
VTETRRGGPDLTAVQLDQTSGDGEAETGAHLPSLLHRCGQRGSERQKYALQLRGVDATTGVSHHHDEEVRQLIPDAVSHLLRHRHTKLRLL